MVILLTRHVVVLLPTPLPEPSNEATVLLSYPFFRQLWEAKNLGVPCKHDFVQNLTPADWRTRFDYLTVDQEWGFLAGQVAGVADGITFPYHGNMILMDSSPLLTLITNNCTLAERCHLIFSVAKGVSICSCYSWLYLN